MLSHREKAGEILCVYFPSFSMGWKFKKRSAFKFKVY